MSPREIQIKLADILFNRPAEQHLPEYRKLHKELATTQEQEVLEALYDMHLNGVIIKAKKIALALIHGIRTQAPWQERIRHQLSGDNTVTVFPIGYGFFNLFSFLLPGKHREKPIKKVARELRGLKKLYPDQTVVAVAHSFGTYIIANILQEEPDIHIDRLLMCGSIVDIDFRWDKLPIQFTRNNVLNDVGTKDIWPILARTFSFGYGCSGTFGFKTVHTTDRYFDSGHSDLFTEEHIKLYWLPFIKEGTIVPSPWDNERPTPSWLLSFLGGFPNIKLTITAAALAICTATFFLAKQGSKLLTNFLG